jgi:uncharacterized protein (DUF2267 family)
MASAREPREFSAGEVQAAEAFIASLPLEIRRVYVEEWDGRQWRFVFGDDRDHAPRGLTRLAAGLRFRIRTG